MKSLQSRPRDSWREPRPALRRSSDDAVEFLLGQPLAVVGWVIVGDQGDGNVALHDITRSVGPESVWKRLPPTFAGGSQGGLTAQARTGQLSILPMPGVLMFNAAIFPSLFNRVIGDREVVKQRSIQGRGQQLISGNPAFLHHYGQKLFPF